MSLCLWLVPCVLQSVALLLYSWCLVPTAATFMYRATPLSVDKPTHNKPWVACAVASLVLEVCACVARRVVWCSARQASSRPCTCACASAQALHCWGSTAREGAMGGVFAELPWYLWVCLCLWPLLSLGVHEMAKRRHAKRFNYEMLARRLKFNTRLGMFSPR